MQLLTLTAGLGLLFVVPAMMPPLTPASPEEILGKWYIRRWAGDLPIPESRWKDPLPPFTFERNSLDELEFRMNLTKPIGCIQYKLPLYEGEDPGMFLTWWRHVIYIHFLPGKKSAIAYFRGKMNYQYYQMLLLMGHCFLLYETEFLISFLFLVITISLEAQTSTLGHTPRPNPDAERIFKESVMSIMPQTGRIITPPHAEACVFVPDPQCTKGVLQYPCRKRELGPG